MIRNRQKQREKRRKLLQKNKLQRKRRRSRKFREIQEEIKNENESLMAAVSRGSRLKEPAVAQAALKTVKACQERIVAKTEDINTK